MKKVPITKEDLLPCVEVVPAGVVEIVRLQREDFAYNQASACTKTAGASASS